METNLIIAGFGGQGVMLMGEILSEAALLENKKVTWLPSYGPEQRGGTANCAVVISDSDEIASPVITNPQTAIVMNLPSFDKFESKIENGGLLIVNNSLIEKASSRKDIKQVSIPSLEIAESLGEGKVANMVILGAYIGLVKPVKLESIIEALKKYMTGKKESLLEVNIKALEKGIEFVKM